MKDKANNIPKKKKHILRKILLTLLVLLILAGAGFYAYSKLKAEYTVTYDTYRASIGTISNSLSFSGSLQAVDNVTYTAGSNGTVRNVYVAAGDDVKKGDKLIRLSGGDTIEAEFDGRVNKLSVAKNDDVMAGDTLIQVADFTHLKVNVRIDEYDIADVAVGQQCRVTATATEQEFDSVIDSIDYISSSGGNVAYYTGTVYVDLKGDEGVYPGMQATVTVPQEEAKDVVVLKMDALSFDTDNSAYVWMDGEDGQMTKVPVTVGVSNGNYVAITEGLNDGDTVYAETKTEDTYSMFASLFGGTRINGMGGGFGGGNMPRGGNYGDGSFGNGSRGGGNAGTRQNGGSTRQSGGGR